MTTLPNEWTTEYDLQYITLSLYFGEKNRPTTQPELKTWITKKFKDFHDTYDNDGNIIPYEIDDIISEHNILNLVTNFNDGEDEDIDDDERDEDAIDDDRECDRRWELRQSVFVGYSITQTENVEEFINYYVNTHVVIQLQQ